MKFRVEFLRRETATTPGQAGMRWVTEVVARSEGEAIELARRAAARVGKDKPYRISEVRKL